jgi:Zn-dependent protease with chaperone function
MNKFKNLTFLFLFCGITPAAPNSMPKFPDEVVSEEEKTRLEAIQKAVNDLFTKIKEKGIKFPEIDGFRYCPEANHFDAKFCTCHGKYILISKIAFRINPSHNEIMGLLAHELGHAHFKHVEIAKTKSKQFPYKIFNQKLAKISTNTALAFALGNYISSKFWSFGLNKKRGLCVTLALITPKLIYSFLNLLQLKQSRKNEYQADAYSAKLTGNQAYADYLRKQRKLQDELDKEWSNNSVLRKFHLFINRFEPLNNHPPDFKRIAKLTNTQ